MGRAIAQIAAERGWPVVATITRNGNSRGAGITRQTLAGADVALEFSVASAAADNILAAVRAGIPVVSGTTGWDTDRTRVSREVIEARGALFWAANFSIGVNLLWQLAERAGRLVGRAQGFDTHIVETHHSAKRDAPSGTAIELARRVADGLGREVPITSVRTGSVPGTHELIFDAPYEQLTLAHVARDRRVFAEGALTAARWLIGRRGVFTMRDLLDMESTTS
jgi:4-hydroxy-tetrahydrodipicolinate reductase